MIKAVVNMAVKGFLNIQENQDEFTLSKTGTGESLLSKGERKIAKKLFQGSDRIKLETANHSRIGKAVEGIIEKKEKFGYFITLEPGITGLLPKSGIRKLNQDH